MSSEEEEEEEEEEEASVVVAAEDASALSSCATELRSGRKEAREEESEGADEDKGNIRTHCSNRPGALE